MKLFQYKTYLLLIIVCFCYTSSFSQVNKPKKDSTEMYSKIKSYTQKHKFTNFFHRYIFRSTRPKKNNELIQKVDTTNYDGKIIRKITIVTLDPFGYSESDSTVTPRNWGERTGNRLHLKTKQFTIRNLLLFKKNTPYDAYKIQESERIIRSQKYINTVSIRGELPNVQSDSVDVTIRVLDSWSYIPKFSISSTQVGIGLKDKNFFGTGQQLEYKFTNRFSDGKNANDFTYTVPNIKNTFINVTAKYNNDLDNNYNKSINIERPFFSPLTRWAGGVYIGQQFRRDSLQGPDLKYSFQNFKYNSQDAWLGKAFPIFKEKERKTNLIVSGRILNVDYIESPEPEYDPVGFYSDEKLMLTGIGINTREFVKDNYIFRNGATEDVATGRIFGITAGYQYKNTLWRPYLGAQASFGDYHKWGFFSADFEFGTFFHQSKTYQSAFAFEANYFTNLMKIGNWKLRQFIKPALVIGANREDIVADQLNINGNNGLQGFNSPIYGTSKMVLSLQTQSYAPHSLVGFRVNPFFNYTVAVLGNPDSAMLRNKAYSKITLGLLISNDYLVFSSFQLSISYYPTIPYEGDNVFKTNTFETTDFGLQSFELAKPKLVEYR
ncbi:hypothetical protein B0A62_19650 [Flavobacterium hydatis]|uniref:Outer membrane protein/protective antigen OMA87 n=2 Tax=Flavobacterium hydatis TaxID=991 RepID=A0ABX4CB86_FLAHY|nr:hypothetical protein B0A62_19650 [Flavobacterium hydatis]